MPKQAYLAIDLGAESGRAIVGSLDAGKLTLHEAHRFTHAPVGLPSGLYWDLTGLWHHILHGIRLGCAYANENDLALRSVGVDTWGVDFGLLGRSGELLGMPHAYRDPRNNRAYKKARDAVGEQAIYQATGIQLMAINSLYQLIAARDAEPAMLDQARHLLFMPDLLHYFLTGKPSVEKTVASTSQMVDTQAGGWATGLLGKLHLPTHLLGRISPPGTPLAPLRPEVARAVGAPEGLRVILPAGHDTACAVAAVPAGEGRGRGAEGPRGQEKDKGGDKFKPSAPGPLGPLAPSWCYLSSGTWSLLGAELDEPCVTDAAFEAGFTNEAGVAGTTRFLKNIAGLWLLQEVRRDYAGRGEQYSYAELVELAEQAQPMRTLVDPNDPGFVAPGEMPRRIADYARRTNQPAPETAGQFARCCLESLALAYREKVGQLERILGHRFEVLHLVGGGGKNKLLNQMTADAIGRAVVVGPYEGTGIGNVLVQAMGDGAVADLAGLRKVVAESFPLETCLPGGGSRAGWDAAAERFAQVQAAAG